MGLLAETFRAMMSLGAETKAIAAMAVPTWQQGTPQTPVLSRYSYDQLARKGYMGSEIVFAAVQAVAKSAALPYMVVYESNDKDADPIYEHPALEVLNHPNNFWTRFQLLASTVVALKIAGNAYWERVRDARGRVVEYWPLRPDRMWIIPDEKEYIGGYEYKLGDMTYRLKREDVIHFRNPHPLNDYYGLAPLAVLIERIDIDVWCREFTAAFFRNAGVPSGLLNIQRSVEPNEREILRQRWKQQYGGPDGWGNLLVIDNGQASYTAMGMGPGANGIGLADINEVSESRICAVLDVPPSIIWTVLGHSSSTGLNNSNKESDRAQWWQGALSPMYEDIAQQFSLASVNTEDWPGIDHFAFDLTQVPGGGEDQDALHARVRADWSAGLVPWHIASGMLGYPTEEPGWLILPSSVIPTPSDQLAKYVPGQTPPGQPPPEAEGQAPSEGQGGSEGGGSNEESGSSGGGGGGSSGQGGSSGGGSSGGAVGAQGGGGAASGGGGAAGAGAGGEGTKLMAMTVSKMTSDGQFEIIPGCTVDSMGNHYRSVQLNMCAWCHTDPYVLKRTNGYDYGSTQLNLPDILGKELIQWAKEHIDPDDLGAGGIEKQPHVTVKYGLMPTVKPTEVARVIKDAKPVSLSFGPNYVFAGDADPQGGVPLYVSINSEDMGRLNGLIKRSLPNVETHANYQPHATIAYIKPEVVNKYVGARSPLYGMHVTLDDFEFSGIDGRRVKIPLGIEGKGLSEGLDSAGGMFVPADIARRLKNGKRTKTDELLELLDYWKGHFAQGGKDFEKCVAALSPNPLELSAWLFHHTTGEWPTKTAANGNAMLYKAGNIEALLDYWRDRFEGGGSFSECVETLGDRVDNPPAVCAWLHHEATGKWPSEKQVEQTNGKTHLNGWEDGVVDERTDIERKVTEQVRQMERALLNSGVPVAPYRPKTQTWLNILDQKAYNPDQPRDERGRFGSGGGGSNGSKEPKPARVVKTPYKLKLPANYGNEPDPPPNETTAAAVARYHALGYIPPKEITAENDAEGLPKFLRGFADTEQLFMGANGKPVDSRVALVYQPIIEQTMRGVSERNPDGVPGGIPKADGPVTVTAIAGGAAGGKSTVLRSGDLEDVPGRDKAIYQEADEYKLAIPEYAALQRVGREDVAAAVVHEESSNQISKPIASQALKNGQNLVADALFNDSVEKNISKVAGFKAQGAEVVNAHYVVTDLAEVADRLAIRGADTGRVVPYDRAMGSHQHVATMLPELDARSPFDSYTVHDTSAEYSPGRGPDGMPLPGAHFLASWDKANGLQVQDQAGYDKALARGQQAIPPKPDLAEARARREATRG